MGEIVSSLNSKGRIPSSLTKVLFEIVWIFWLSNEASFIGEITVEFWLMKDTCTPYSLLLSC